jgi:glycosyltransferase involved in cell wall biosynthesis
VGPQPILIVARPAEGGIRTHIVQLLEFLDRDRFQVSLAAPRQFIESLPGNLPPYSPHLLALAAKPSPLDPFVAARLSQLAELGAGIVHAHGLRAGFVASLARAPAPFHLVVTHHNLPSSSPLATLALGIVGRRADANIAVSRAIASAMQSIVPAPVVIPNGIDLRGIGEPDRLATRESWSATPERIVVVCVARLCRDKGVDILLRAASLIPDALFIVAGAGPERRKLEARAPANVRFVGYVPRAAETLAAADIVAIPSRREGQGIVALEAMAAGVPIVAADVGGLPEMVRDGSTGILFPSEDAARLAATIARLTADSELRARLAESAMTWVTANGDVRPRVKQIEAVYDQVAAAYVQTA